MITFAPTSAGKSHYVAHVPTNHKRIDFDLMVAAFVGWPDKPRWWSDPKIAGPFGRRTFKLLIALDLLHHKEEFLFNMDPRHVDPELLKGHYVRVVVPHHATLKRNAESKAAEQKLGRKLGQPVDLRSIYNSAASWLDWAEKHGVHVSQSFEDRFPTDPSGYRAVFQGKPL